MHDTSVLIGADAPGDVEAAISVASLTGLHVGVLLAYDEDERARRVNHLAVIEAAFDPLPISVEVACVGSIRGRRRPTRRRSRRRQMDLAIAATAAVEQVPLLTHDLADSEIIGDLVDARQP
ncbi:VapC toxin family PIN domain ribonuclease [Geodermatophilus sp. SYSU D01176]